MIVVVAQLLGSLAQRCAQPRVIGEMLGGIVLGPSLLGALAPALEQRLFGPEVLPQLRLLGQLGLVLFMFLVGLELNPRLLRHRFALASRLTAAGMLLPLALGLGLAAVLEAWQPALLPGDRAPGAALLLATALAVSAFPVLVRILRDRGLLLQPLGGVAIATAALGDVLGWILLAAVVAFAGSGSWARALPPLLGASLWALLLLIGLQPLRRWLERSYRRHHRLGPLLQAALFSGALVSAAVTAWIGVHLVFGAFLWGLAMPRYPTLRRRLQTRLETVVLQLLLPLFFAISGLNTRIGSLGTAALWAAAALVLLVAVGSKLLGTWLTARLSGLPPREAQALGWLLNSRGLTVLVILNVGLEIEVLSTPLFTIGVLMVLVTTLMTGPLLGRLGYPPLPSAA